MSHSALFVFLVALAVTALVNAGEQPCQGKASKGHWGGVCFGDHTEIKKKRQCTTLIDNNPLFNINGCPEDKSCCCVDCNRQTKQCRKKWNGSSARNIHGYPLGTPGKSVCCEHELLLGTPPRVKEGSMCYCCKHCKRKPHRCRRHGSRCVTEADPVYNVTWCEENGGRIKERDCMGYDCWCCKFPPPLTTPPN